MNNGSQHSIGIGIGIVFIINAGQGSPHPTSFPTRHCDVIAALGVPLWPPPGLLARTPISENIYSPGHLPVKVMSGPVPGLWNGARGPYLPLS